LPVFDLDFEFGNGYQFEKGRLEEEGIAKNSNATRGPI
jgi:hypothetical protein